MRIPRRKMPPYKTALRPSTTKLGTRRAGMEHWVMASEQEIGRKEIETSELIPFLEARELVTGEDLSLILGVWTENPDFICVRPDGSVIGVELTMVTEDREVAFWDRLRYGEVQIDPFGAQETIHYLIARKEKARAERYTKKVSDNILVLQLVDGSFSHLTGAFDGLETDFASHGFAEVWLADYSGLDAYGDVELFGLYPLQWWGRHTRPFPDRKPYG